MYISTVQKSKNEKLEGCGLGVTRWTDLPVFWEFRHRTVKREQQPVTLSFPPEAQSMSAPSPPHLSLLRLPLTHFYPAKLHNFPSSSSTLRFESADSCRFAAPDLPLWFRLAEMFETKWSFMMDHLPVSVTICIETYMWSVTMWSINMEGCCWGRCYLQVIS